MAIVSTEIVVVASDASYTIPGDWSASQIAVTYAAQIPGIGNMTSEERVETRANGDVKIVTFRPRTGTKG